MIIVIYSNWGSKYNNTFKAKISLLMSNTDSPQKQGLDMPEGGKFEDYLQVLIEHQRNCEREGNFAEAEVAKSRIEELKVQEAQRSMENLLLKQQ